MGTGYCLNTLSLVTRRSLNDRLTDKKPIEGMLVRRGQCGDGIGMMYTNLEQSDGVLRNLLGDDLLDRVSK